MLKEYRIIFLNILISSAFFVCGLLIANHAHAQSDVPGLPFQLYGKVTYANASVVPNASVIVEINGVEVAKSVANLNSEYGLAPNVLMITDPRGVLATKPLEIIVNGLVVNKYIVFEPGVLREVNLIIPVNSANSDLGKTKQIQQIKATSSNTTIDESKSEEKESTSSDEVIYKTPVFHLTKHQSRSSYKKYQENKANHHHSRFLGLTAFILVVIILSWVYLQNYLHKRRQKF